MSILLLFNTVTSLSYNEDVISNTTFLERFTELEYL